MITVDDLDSLEDLLDRERIMLVRGDLDAIQRQRPELIRLTAAIGQAPESSRIERVRRKAVHNRSLFEAASEGIRAAKARLQEIREAAHAHRTYASDGESRQVGLARRTVTRRA